MAPARSPSNPVRRWFFQALPRLAFLSLLLTAPASHADLLISNSGTNSVLRYDSATGAFIDEFVPNGSGGLIRPIGLAVGPDQNLYGDVCTLAPFTLPPGNYGLAITFNGIGPSYPAGNGTATPGSGTNQTFSTSEITMLCGASSQGAPGAAICCEPRVFSGSIHYAVGGSGTVAQRTTYGTGCYLRAASFYESFATSV